MTDITWGEPIEVNGVRPDWLGRGDQVLFENTENDWLGVGWPRSRTIAA